VTKGRSEGKPSKTNHS